MKDYFGLTNDELRELYLEEISNGRLQNALILWGMIKFRCNDEKRYCLASILARMGKTDECIYWAKKITNPQYLADTELMILDVYSETGKIEEFADYFTKDFRGGISFIQLMNYIYRMLYFSKRYTYAEDECRDRLLERILNSNKYSIDIKNVEKKDYDLYLLNTLYFSSLYIEAIKVSMDISIENNLEGTTNAVAKAYGLYNLVSICFQPFADDYSISKFMDDYEGTLSRFLFETKVSILNMNEYDYKWKIYYSILVRLSDENTLINEVYRGLNYFPDLITHYGYEAVYPLLIAYAKAMNCEDYRAIEFEKVLSLCGVKDDALNKATMYDSVIRQLSVKSQIAYKSACALYTMAKSNNYEQKDAGPISLAFYRILELESNIVIWKPIIQRINIDELQRLYNELSNEDKRKWSMLLTIFKEMEKDDEAGLMIGNIRALMQNIKGSDALANRLRNEFIEVLTADGMNAFERGLIDEWYSKENADKYRNPPAHAKYLHFDVVENCKIYVETEVLNMGKWIRRGAL